MKTDTAHRPGVDNNCVELERTRLLDAMVPRFQPGMVLTLTSGPGTGKTVFIRQLQALKGGRTASIDLAGFSADSSILIRQFERIFLQLWPDLSTQRQEQGMRAESGHQNPLERFESLLDELLISGDIPAVIALDGCEILADRPLWMDLVSLLLHRLPSFISLILSSRLPLHFHSLPTLRLQGRLLEVGPEDLHFDEHEIFCFLSSRFATINVQDAALVHEKVGGWPAGIALLRMEMEKRGVGLLDTASTACLHEYMQCAVFSGLTSDTRQIFCSLGLVQPFDDHVISGLFGQQQQQVTEVITTFSFFFAPRSKKDDEYQFAHLYADFFQGQAPVVLGRKGVNELHQRAAAFFKQRGENGRALEHLIALQEWHESVELILSTYKHWFDSEDYSQLPYWAEQLPADVLQSHIWLNILLGQAYLYLGHLDAAGQALSRAHAGARPGSKNWLEAGCLLCEIMLLQGNKEEEVLLAGELASRARLISRYRVRATMYQAIGLHLLCRFVECERLWQKITTIASSRFVPLSRASRSYIMAPKAVFHNLERGEFEESNRILDEAISVFRVRDPMKRLGWMLLFKGICKLEMHQYTEALVWMREAEVVSSRTNRSVHATCIAFLALTLSILDQPDEAAQWLKRAEPLASRDLSMWAPIICSLARAQLCRTSDGITADLQLAWNLASERLMLFPMTQTAYVAYSLEGKMAGSDLAVQYCRQAAEKSRQWNVAHREARLLLYLFVQQRDSNPEQAHTDFQRAMELISENGHGFLLTGDKRLDGLSLVLLALERNIGTDFFLQLAAFWGKQAFEALAEIFVQARLELKTKIIILWVNNGYRPALGLIEQTLQEARGKKTKTRLRKLQKRLQQCPSEPLHVHLFGRFSVIRDEEEVPETAWKRHKARDLFKFLCLHPKMVFTREQLTELFWPEVSPDKAKGHLWSAISTIRAALEPELPARAKSSYLCCTSQTYALDLPDGSSIDTEVFTRKIREGRRFMEQDDTARALLCFEAVVPLYRDGLLPGDRYAPWCEEPQEHYRQLLTDTLRTMASIYMEKRYLDEAIKVYRQIISMDSWDEASCLELMRCYVLQGRELKAVELYQHFEEVLDRELGVAPASDLREFVQRILRRRQSALQKNHQRLPDPPN